MNNTFNLKRFGLLFKKYTIEHGKAHLLSIGVLIGILTITMGFATLIDKRLTDTAQIMLFSTGLLITGCIFTSMIFISLSDKKKAIPELTLPVSHFEKYLVAWLYSFPIFLVIFISAFYLTASVIQSITPDRLGYGKDILINVFDPEQDAIGALFGFAFLHGLTFWGAIFFTRLHFIKTAFVFFISVMTLIVVNRIVFKALLTEGRFSNNLPYSSVHFYDESKMINISVSHNIMITGAALLVVIVLLLWTSAFYRLKEKEV